MTVKEFKALTTKCQSVTDGNDFILNQVAEKMISKLHKYDSLLYKDVAQLARGPDSRFGNDILSDSKILRRHVNLPIESYSTRASKQTDTLSAV